MAGESTRNMANTSNGQQAPSGEEAASTSDANMQHIDSDGEQKRPDASSRNNTIGQDDQSGPGGGGFVPDAPTSTVETADEPTGVPAIWYGNRHTSQAAKQSDPVTRNSSSDARQPVPDQNSDHDRDSYLRPNPVKQDILRFPPCPDKSENAPIWKTYVEKTDKYDEHMLKAWNDGIENFLLFTGLFSAILAAFLIYSWTLLQPDNTQATVDALVILSQQLVNMSSGRSLEASLSYRPEPFIVPSSALAVNGLWFTALFMSLLAAVTAMLVKEWLTSYSKDLPITPLRKVEERQLRYNGLIGWKVPMIITLLPLVIHLALFVFFVGLVILAWTVNTALAIWMATLLIFGFCLYCVSAIAPMTCEGCPYKSPMYIILSRLGDLSTTLSSSGPCTAALRILYYFESLYDLGERIHWKLSSREHGTDTESRRAVGPAEQGMTLEDGRASPDQGQASDELNRDQVQRPTFVEFRDRHVLMRAYWTTSKEDKLKKQRFALQEDAVIWLVNTPDHAAQDMALFFLSWWRMSSRHWNREDVKEQIREAAERRVPRRWEYSQVDVANADQRSHCEEAVLVSVFLHEEREEWLSPVQISREVLTDEYEYDVALHLPDCLNAVWAWRRWHISADEIVFCASLECALPIAIGADIDWPVVTSALGALAECVWRYPTHDTFLNMYLDILSRSFDVQEDKITDPLTGPMDWERRYLPAEGPTALGNRMMESIDILRQEQLPQLWAHQQERADSIRGALIRRFRRRQILAETTQATPYRVSFLNIANWIRTPEPAPVSILVQPEHEVIAALLLDAFLPENLWTLVEDFELFQDVVNLWGATRPHSRRLQKAFDQCVTLADSGSPNREICRLFVISDRGIPWMLEQLHMGRTWLSTPVIVISYEALHWTDKFLRFGRPYRRRRTEREILDTLEQLHVKEWLKCMHSYGLDHIWSYSERDPDGAKKLRGMFEYCVIKIVRRKRKEEVDTAGSELMAEYKERFGVDLQAVREEATPLHAVTEVDEPETSPAQAQVLETEDVPGKSTADGADEEEPSSSKAKGKEKAKE